MGIRKHVPGTCSVPFGLLRRVPSLVLLENLLTPGQRGLGLRTPRGTEGVTGLSLLQPVDQP